MSKKDNIKNVIFIMLDTLQFNYLGCYGNDVVKTPNLDKFAQNGFLFENAYSEGLPTIPVRRAIMTGRFTLPYSGWRPLTTEDTSITDMLWCREVQTALVYDTPPHAPSQVRLLSRVRLRTFLQRSRTGPRDLLQRAA